MTSLLTKTTKATGALKKVAKAAEALSKIVKPTPVPKRKQDNATMLPPSDAGPSWSPGPSHQPSNASLNSDKHHRIDLWNLRGSSAAPSSELVRLGYSFQVIGGDHTSVGDRFREMKKMTWRNWIMMLMSECDMVNRQIEGLKTMWREEFKVL